MSSKMVISNGAPTLDLNALARFAAIVELGGFSPAARNLGVPRQSLHRGVAHLEEVLGVRLLDRSARQIRPTDAGRRLFAHAAAILREARDAESGMRAARARPRGRLRLTAPHLFAEEFLPPLIEEFLKTWPDVQIDADLTVTHADVVRDDYDLALRIGPAPASGRYTRALGSLERVCCASPGYLAVAPSLATPRALGRQAVLVYGAPQARPSWRFERAGEAIDVALSPRLRVDSARVVLAACRAGLGVACLPEFLCAADIAGGALTRVWGEWRVAAAPVWAVYSSRSDRSPTLHAFLELLEARLARPSATPSPLVARS